MSDSVTGSARQTSVKARFLDSLPYEPLNTKASQKRVADALAAIEREAEHPWRVGVTEIAMRIRRAADLEKSDGLKRALITIAEACEMLMDDEDRALFAKEVEQRARTG